MIFNHIDQPEKRPTFDYWQKEIKDLTNKFEQEKLNLQKEYEKKIIALKKDFDAKGLDKGILIQNDELLIDNQAIFDKQFDQLQTELFQKEHALKEEYEKNLKFLESNANAALSNSMIEQERKDIREEYEKGFLNQDEFEKYHKNLLKRGEANNANNAKNEETLENIVIQIEELQEKFKKGDINENEFYPQLTKLQEQLEDLRKETDYTTETGAKKLFDNLLNKVNAALNNKKISSAFAREILNECNQIFNLITQRNNALKNDSYKLFENLSEQIIQRVNRAKWFISKCEENPEWKEKDFIDDLSENEAIKKFHQQEQEQQDLLKQQEQEQQNQQKQKDLLQKQEQQKQQLLKQQEQERQTINQQQNLLNQQQQQNQQEQERQQLLKKQEQDRQQNDENELDRMLRALRES